MKATALIKRLDNFLRLSLRVVIAMSLSLVMLGSCFSVLLRWVGASPLWLEPLIRHLVFLLAFLGAALAVEHGKHVVIDLVPMLLRSRQQQRSVFWLERLGEFVGAIITFVLAYYAWQFFRLEMEYGRKAFLGIHSSFLVGIIPLGAIILSYSFCGSFIRAFVEEKK